MPETPDSSGTAPLRRGLSQRQLNMIALGGVIGAGLFVGSGVIIGETGPGAFITYALCGVLVVMVMRMLGEMATANPSTGSFADYARQALGGWAGFSVGWLYWYFWVVVVGFEAIAGGAVLSYWINAPLWLLSLVLMVAMTATNLFSVAAFGEFEFWFAGIKVAAIVAFLALGSLFVLGFWPRHSLDFSNLTAHGGFFPNGVGTVFGAISVVIAAMVGAEVATIAAAETANPERAVARATKSVVVRIVIFYLGSVFLLAVIVPWNAERPGVSPYVVALGEMGIPAAGHIMNAVVLTAVLSCLNSGLYTASRMLFVLAARGEAPIELVKVGRRGVPYAAILVSSIVGFVCVLMAWVAPGAVFTFLLKSSGSLVLSVYLMIALSQIVLRRRTPPDAAAGEDVVVPGPVDTHRGCAGRRAGADGVRPERPDGTVAGAAVLGGGVDAVLRAALVARIGEGRAGARRRAARRTGYWCWPTKTSLRVSFSMCCAASTPSGAPSTSSACR